MSIEKIRNIGLDKLVTQVYDFDSLTTDELMCKFAQKINIIIEHLKYVDDRCHNSDKALELKLQYLLDQGLEEQVAKRLLELTNNGTLGKLINETLLKDINDKVDNFKIEVNGELVSITNKINSINILVTNYRDLVVGNDWTNAINKAIEDCSITGGKVLCPVGTCLISQIKLRSNVILEGNFYKTVLKSIDNNDNDNLIILYDNNTYLTGIRNLYIDGNNGNQTKSIRGILIDNSKGSTPIYDHHGIYENLYIENTSGEGFFLNNTRENRVKNVQVRKCTKSGFGIYGSDNWILDCTSAGNKGKGFEIGSYNTKFTTCKAFFNGETNGNSGEGFYLENAHFNQFSNCEAQEAGSHGIRLVNSHNNIFSSTISDSNGVYNKVDSVGLILEDSSFNNIQISVFSRGNDLQGNQKIGIKITGLSADNVINAIVNDTKQTGMIYCNVTNVEIYNKNYITINGEKYTEGKYVNLDFIGDMVNKKAFPLIITTSNGGTYTTNVNLFNKSQVIHLEGTQEYSTVRFSCEIDFEANMYNKIVANVDYKQMGDAKFGVEMALLNAAGEVLDSMSGASGVVTNDFKTLGTEKVITSTVTKCKMDIIVFVANTGLSGDAEFKNISIYLNKK